METISRGVSSAFTGYREIVDEIFIAILRFVVGLLISAELSYFYLTPNVTMLNSFRKFLNYDQSILIYLLIFVSLYLIGFIVIIIFDVSLYYMGLITHWIFTHLKSERSKKMWRPIDIFFRIPYPLAPESNDLVIEYKDSLSNALLKYFKLRGTIVDLYRLCLEICGKNQLIKNNKKDHTSILQKGLFMAILILIFFIWKNNTLAAILLALLALGILINLRRLTVSSVTQVYDAAYVFLLEKDPTLLRGSGN